MDECKPLVAGRSALIQYLNMLVYVLRHYAEMADVCKKIAQRTDAPRQEGSLNPKL